MCVLNDWQWLNLNKKLSCPRAEGIPWGKVGIHCGAKKKYLDSRRVESSTRFRGNDKLSQHPAACLILVSFFRILFPEHLTESMFFAVSFTVLFSFPHHEILTT